MGFYGSHIGSYEDEHLGTVTVLAQLTIEPAQSIGRGFTIDHQPIPDDALDVSISGESYYKAGNGRRMELSGGQNIDDARKANPRIAELWERWHLNGLRPNCIHMGSQTYQPGLACPAGGRNEPPYDGVSRITPVYTSGTAWLFEPVPAEVLAELRRLFGKPEGWQLDRNRFSKGVAR